MSMHLPFRSFNRSQKVRVNGSALSATVSTWLNIDNPRVQRDIARHSAIGAIQDAGDNIGFTSDGYLLSGGAVSKTAAGSLNLTVTTAFVQRANATQVTVNGVTNLAVGAGGATGPRIDVVAVDTATPALVVIAGTAAGVANANLFNRLSIVADLPANRIPIALVLVPTSAANLDNATIVPLR